MPLTPADALALLTKAKENDRLAHAYLITGPQGCGKRELAADLCALLTGTATDPLRHTDVHVVEPESKSRRIVTEQVRDLERQLQMKSSRGGRKVGVIFDADRLQPQASNAFLKTLEEPPSHSHLLLVTAFPDQLLETILSRCIEIPIKETTKPQLTSTQESLLAVLQDWAERNNGALSQVFTLVREFQKLLAEAKEGAQAQGERELKAEEQRYKNVADSKWLEDREDYFKALTEARYIGERTRLLETLEQWWADVLRQQALRTDADAVSANGAVSNRLDFPAYARQTAHLASRFPAHDALNRAGALESLRDQLRNPGINEPLAIEVAFLKAFGDR